MKIFGALWNRLAKPLQDFGFGRTRIMEGGVGLFIVGGALLGALIAGWIVGIFNNARKNSYQAFIEFPLACGIQCGTNVRIRGVKAGTVLSVQPALDKVTVLVEMDDKKVPIPRNSTIDANQSGLIAETIIDITPKLPIPQAQWGPLDAGCEGEGVIVCDRGRIEGRPGVSMDDLVGICTRLAKEMEQQDGIRKMFQVTDGAQDLMQVLEPLLTEAALIARELRPMMQGVKDQGTLETIELLAGHASATVQDIRELRQTILTEENQDMLRQSSNRFFSVSRASRVNIGCASTFSSSSSSLFVLCANSNLLASVLDNPTIPCFDINESSSFVVFPLLNIFSDLIAPLTRPNSNPSLKPVLYPSLNPFCTVAVLPTSKPSR